MYVTVQGFDGSGRSSPVLCELSGRLARAADPPSADPARAGAS